MASIPAKKKLSFSTSSLSSSSSSSPIPCRANLKPRNSETGNMMRRSFQRDPFPAEASQRNSTGRKSNRGELGNVDHHISNVVKAPKPVKNFMLPTISTASKCKPSPMKKTLSVKKEVTRSLDKTHHQVRSSISFSDEISNTGEDEDNHQIYIDEKKQLEEVSQDVTVTDYDEKPEKKENDDTSFKSSPLTSPVSNTFPVSRSHEVDPSIAPYDPKNNYLSPRPEYLHYSPKRRTEHDFDECKQHEELSISERSASETDLSEKEESLQEEEDASQEGVVPVEEKKDQYGDGEDRLKPPESDEEKEEEMVGESIEEETHQSSFKTSKLLGWILALGLAYLLLVSLTTFSQTKIIKDSPFYHFHIPPEVTKSARRSFEQSSVKLGMWVKSSLVYLDKLVSSRREEEGYGPFRFYNLTDTLEGKGLSDNVFQPDSGEIRVAGLLEMDIEEENVGHQQHANLEVPSEADGKGEVKYSEMVYEFDTQTESMRAIDREINLSEEGNCGQEIDGVEGQREYEENGQKNNEEGHESGTRLAQNDEKDMEEAESDAFEVDDVVSAVIRGHQQEETVSEEEGIAIKSSGVSAEEYTDVEHDDYDLEEESEFDEGSERNLLINQKKVIVTFSAMVLLAAAAAAAASSLLDKKKAEPVTLLHEDSDPITISDTKAVNFEHVPVGTLIRKRISALKLNYEEEVDDHDRKREVSSFSSEMSFSSHKNKSLHDSNKKDNLKEYESRGGSRKRKDSCESIVSSASEYSKGSVSFGSFITHEKIQKKNGDKEEEIITPVRRSSRIRNLALT